MSLLYDFNKSAVTETVRMKWPSDTYLIPAGTPMSRTGIANDGTAIGILASTEKVRFPYPDSIAPLVGKQEPKGNVETTFTLITAGFVDMTRAEKSFGGKYTEEAKAAMSKINFVDSSAPGSFGGGTTALANALGEVKVNAEAAVHGAVIAGEGALVVPFMEANMKAMNGEVVAEQYIHVSDKVPTMADLQAGYSMMMYNFAGEEGYLAGAHGEPFEVPPKVLEEELFTAVTIEVDGAILFANGAGIIVPTDNYDPDLSKKGIYIMLGICALRINGYSFSGAELPFGEVTKYGDTVTWGGDISGKVYAQPTSEDAVYVVKVSDAVPTAEDCAEGVTAVHSEGVTVSEIVFNDDGFGMVNEIVLIVPWGNYQYGDITFPQSGVYFLKTTGEYEGYVTSFTIPGYTGFATGTEINTIDPKYLPEALQFGQQYYFGSARRATVDDALEAVNPENCLVWDGDTTGLERLEYGSWVLYHVSSVTPSQAEIDVGFDVDGHGNEIIHQEHVSNLADLYCFVVQVDGATYTHTGTDTSLAMRFPKAGIYLHESIRSLVLSGYIFPRTKCAKMDEELLPESVESVVIRSSTEGSTKKFKVTVDDSGSITATEVT